MSMHQQLGFPNYRHISLPVNGKKMWSLPIITGNYSVRYNATFTRIWTLAFSFDTHLLATVGHY
jgi:hypothetical protein